MTTYTIPIQTADDVDHGMARYEGCLDANIYRFEDGYVLCPLLWSGARRCEECMEIFERRVENGAVGAETQGA